MRKFSKQSLRSNKSFNKFITIINYMTEKIITIHIIVHKNTNSQWR